MNQAHPLSGQRGRRRRLLQQMAAGVAGGILGVLQQAWAAQPETIRQGVRSVRGTVLVNGEPARVGTLVPPGATVVTQRASEVTYVVGEDAFLQRANARVQIDGAARVFRVVTGALLSVFGRGNPATIHMPVATAGIRGTGCYIQVEARRTYFCLCYGGMELTPAGGQTRAYSTTHHESPLWIADGKVEPAGMLNHEDTELALLENLVGRQVPFAIPYTR